MYTENKQFSNYNLKKIDEANDLHISPFREDGKTYGTPTWIWAVVVEGDLFVRAYNGINSRWYKSAIQQKDGRIQAAGMTKEVAFELVDGTINESIDDGYRKKYRGSPYLNSMISERAKEATIKILPGMEQFNRDIFERDKSGEIIRLDDPEYPKLFEVILKAIRTTAKLNMLVTDDLQKIRDVLSELIGKRVDDTFFLIPPFYSDFGENISIGKNVFVNHACTFMDRGSITLEDNVLISPKVNLITTNHPLEATERRTTISNPIVIKRNAWIGAAATIMP